MNTMRTVLLGSAVASASAIGARGYHNTTTAATPHVVYTTEVVTALTTYCPAPTTITHGTKTYTITSATTLTITDCPCTVSKPVHPTGTPGDECSKKCYDAYNVCRGKPGANFSYCASEFAKCLGYNPYDSNGSLVTPTACSKPASSTPSPTHTPTADECAKDCYNAYNVCRSKPHANFSYCGSEFAGCLGYNPFAGGNGTLVTPTACSGSASATATSPCPTETQVHDCAAKCSETYNKCCGKSGANMSTCASDYASCLGYNPFGADGSLVTPTACSKPVATSTAVPTEPVVVPSKSQPVDTTAAPTGSVVPTQPAGGKDCAEMCYDAFNQCRGKAGANMSTCASEFAGCLGYNPFDGNGSLVTPTACSAGATAPATGNPTGTPTGTPVVTAGAGAVVPAKVLLALGAIALL